MHILGTIGDQTVIAPDLNTAMPLVTTGAYQLSDGMAVRTGHGGIGQLSFSAWLGRHRRSVLLLAAALAFGGIAAAISLPIGLFPQVSFPRVRVIVDTGSQPASQMVLQVTQPIEQAVRTVPGVVDVTSTTSRGAAQMIIDFGWGTDMMAATLGVNAAVSQLLPSLPPAPPIRCCAWTLRSFPSWPIR